MKNSLKKLLALSGSSFALVVALTPAPCAALSLTEADIDALGRVAFAEAAREPDMGIKAVVEVILNRAEKAGSSIEEVVDAPHQFEPVMRAGGTWRNLPQISAFDQGWIAGLAHGKAGDQTGGALYFQNPKIVADRARKGKVSANLVDFGGKPVTAEIGNHRFYGGTGRPAASTIAVGNEGPPKEVDRGPTRLVFGG